MKNDNWLIYIVIAFTSLTTFGLLSDGSILGFARGVMGAVILDGLVIYWEGKRATNKNDKQRQWSSNMMWAGVSILLLFAVGYAIEYYLPTAAPRRIDIFNFPVVLTLSEMIVYGASTVIGLWVVLTLGMVLWMRGIDPETIAEIANTQAEHDKEQAHRAAAQERQDEQLNAYRIASKFTSKEFGLIKAMEDYRRDLLALNIYTAGEVTRMVDDARVEIARQQIVPQVGIPVNSTQSRVNTYNADAGANTPVFTSPSTQSQN